MQEIWFIRHGATRGNAEGRYIGSTNEKLLPESREQLLLFHRRVQDAYGEAALRDVQVFTSPLTRCIETAALLFPGAEPTLVADLRECEFGDFEYRNYAELNGNPAYQRFIDSGGTTAFPGGETRAAFSRRVTEAYLRLEKERANRTVFVVHGGTIMALLDRFSDPHEEYFHWQLPCGEGFRAIWEDEKLREIRRL